MNEGDLIKAMHEDFKGQHLAGFWRKIHGDKYMAGMPDVLASLPDVAALTEFKWEDRDKWLMMPFDAMVKENLTGLQAAELTMLGIMGETCPLRARVLIGFHVESESGINYEMACGFDMDMLNKYRTFSALDLATVAVHARELPHTEGDESWKKRWQFPKEFFPQGGPIGMELQLRKTPSSEHWRVGALVLGMRRYQVFGIRKVHDSEAWDAMYGDE